MLVIVCRLTPSISPMSFCVRPAIFRKMGSSLVKQSVQESNNSLFLCISTPSYKFIDTLIANMQSAYGNICYYTLLCRFYQYNVEIFSHYRVGLSMMCYTLGKLDRTCLGDCQLRRRIGKLL